MKAQKYIKILLSVLPIAIGTGKSLLKRVVLKIPLCATAKATAARGREGNSLRKESWQFRRAIPSLGRGAAGCAQRQGGVNRYACSLNPSLPLPWEGIAQGRSFACHIVGYYPLERGTKTSYGYSKFLKAITLAIGMLIAGSASAQVTYPWFVQTDVAKASGATSDSLLYNLAAKYRQTSRTFVDGLGRGIQSIALQASPLQNDIIQPVVYDNLGRQTVSYMAYAGKSTDSMGRYRLNALTAQAAFYNQTSQYLVAVDTAPHAEQIFEKSPLQRLLSSGMVGTGYQPGDAGTQHYKTVSYRPNTATDSVYLTGTTGVFTSYYAANKLWVTDAIDEDLHEALIFKDLAGRTLLKRQMNGTKHYDTYYIYDYAGAISYIVPPKAVTLLKAGSTLTSTAVANLIYSYSYNSLGLLYAKTTPNKGTTFIIYDPQNRPLLTRDSNMYAKHQWYYIKYDAKGRVISTGIYTDATHTTFSSMLSYVNSNYGTTYWYESRTTVSTYQYYTDNVFPTAANGSGITPMSYNYYDNYDYNGDGVYDYAYKPQGLLNEESATLDSLKGLPTMSLKLTIGPGITTPEWLMTVMFYDKYGHVIQSRTNNQLYYAAGTLTDSKTTVPDFTGKPLVTKAAVQSASGTTNSVTTTFNYDNMNIRLASLDQVYNSQASKRIASYVYNEAGQLILKKLDSLSGTYLQNVDYRYNIRGQLTYINNSTLLPDSGKTNIDSNDLFGMEIMYDKPDTHIGAVTPSYTGMISAVKWMTVNGTVGTKTNERSYVYNYDKVGRDTSSWYAERPAGTTYPFNTNLHGFDEFGITYDEGGNILTLKRNSATIGATSHTLVDNLAYTYDSNLLNRLDNVNDLTNNVSYPGFRNLTGSTSNYAYDNDGNLITDPYKGLTLKYNTAVNRADSLMFSVGGSTAYITYTYDAGGNVIRKQLFSSLTTLVSTVDYIGGFVYTTPAGGTATLSYIQNAEGRIINNSGTLTAEYVISDQQGNARFSFSDNGTALTIRQENSYYAFGEQLAGSPVTTPTTPNINLYNGGSEWQALTSELPDYDQTLNRNYDPAIGRFIAVDPSPESADDMNVYQYAGDNPISNNDPLGNLSTHGNEYGQNHAVTGFPNHTTAFDEANAENAEADSEFLMGMGELLGLTVEENWYAANAGGSGGSGGSSSTVDGEGNSDGSTGAAGNYGNFLKAVQKGVANSGGSIQLSQASLDQLYAAYQNGMQAFSFNINDDGTVTYDLISILASRNDDQGAGVINIYRQFETDKSTISTFSTGDGSVKGYILEPPGASTAEHNTNHRIPAGIYHLIHHPHASLHAEWELYNDEVPGDNDPANDRGVLLHIGNYPSDTEACLIPGSTISLDFVGGSAQVLKQLNNYINSFNGNVIINIYDPPAHYIPPSKPVPFFQY